mmetsp:Transcript_28928/g.54270  ORF Transcript_28928/g.54270 Transcript_28928/m.54270 type:complete len:324 (+) Transcript_28928:59-1030(+)
MWAAKSRLAFRAAAQKAWCAPVVRKGRCATALGGSILGTCALAQGWLRLMKPCACSDLEPLPAQDQDLLIAVLDGAMRNLREWSKAPTTWWDECKSIRIPGLRDALHCTKRLDDFPVRLHMVSAVWDNTTLDELILLTDASDNCLKLRFDPAIDSFRTRLEMENTTGRVRLIRTITKPMLLGLISAREVDSVLKEPDRLPDGSVVGGALGLQSSLLWAKIQKNERLHSLSLQPPTHGRIRAIDHTSGYIFEPLDGSASSGGKGEWKVYYIVLGEAGGGVPLWAAEKGVSKATVDWFRAAYKAKAEGLTQPKSSERSVRSQVAA